MPNDNRIFTFKSKEIINKIGFEEFDLTFGVTGEQYWLELANGKDNNNFHANQVLPPSIFFTSGTTDFDQKEDSFLNNCTISPHDSTIEKSTEQKYSGSYSLRFDKANKAAHSNQRPEITVPCNYEQGHGTFSFRFYVTNINNQIQVYFDSFLYITISSGKITVNSNQLTYEANTWNYLIINIDFGDAKTKKTYDIELNGVKYTGKEISYTTLGKFGIQIIQSQNDTFIDDLTCKTDYEIPKYYRLAYNENSEILGISKKFEDLILIQNESNIEVPSKEKEGENKMEKEEEEEEENKKEDEKEEKNIKEDEKEEKNKMEKEEENKNENENEKEEDNKNEKEEEKEDENKKEKEDEEKKKGLSPGDFIGITFSWIVLLFFIVILIAAEYT